MVAEDNKDVKKTGDGEAVKDIDEKEPHGKTSYLWSKEGVINEGSACGPFPQNAIDTSL